MQHVCMPTKSFCTHVRRIHVRSRSSARPSAHWATKQVGFGTQHDKQLVDPYLYLSERAITFTWLTRSWGARIAPRLQCRRDTPWWPACRRWWHMAHSGACRVSWRGWQGCVALKGASRRASRGGSWGGGGSGSWNQDGQLFGLTFDASMSTACTADIGIDGEMLSNSQVYE